MPTRQVSISLPILHECQRQIVRERARFNVINCGRRWGKSVLLMDFAAETILTGKPVGWFAPSYKILNPMWEELKELFAPITKKRSEEDHLLTMLNGGSIECWSLADNEDAGRSRKYARVIVDEAAMVKALEDIWGQAIRPTLSDYEGDAYFGSTPKGLNFFKTLHARGEDPLQPTYKSWTFPTRTNPHISPAEVEAAREDLPALIYQQEYEAAFIADGSGVFRRVLDCARLPLEERAPYPGVFAMGVDWGQANDFTVLTVIDLKSGEVVAWDRFNQIDWHVQRARLKALWERWRVDVIVAEENSIGKVNIDELRRDGIPIQPFYTTEATKREVIEQLALDMENGEITYPPYPPLVNELMAYEITRLPSGRIRYDAPSGSHDDTVISLALANHARAHRGNAREAIEKMTVYYL